MYSIKSTFNFATIFTPQGDGNTISLIHFKRLYKLLRYDIYPARGRKLLMQRLRLRLKLLTSLRYLPRKGTETKEFTTVLNAIYKVLRYDIYPARGRKLNIFNCFFS